MVDGYPQNYIQKSKYYWQLPCQVLHNPKGPKVVTGETSNYDSTL